MARDVHHRPRRPHKTWRTHAGGLLLLLGLLAASGAYATMIVRGIVVDNDVSAQAAGRAIGDVRVQKLLVDQTADAVRTQLLGVDVVTYLENLDPAAREVDADLRAVAAAVVAAPEFHEAFVSTVRDLHQLVFVARGPAPVVDATPLVAVARDAAIARNPAYAALIPTTATLTVSIPTSDLPDLTGVTADLRSRTAPFAIAAIALAAAAFALHDRRPRALRRVAYWLLGAGLLQVSIALALPLAADLVGGDAGPIAEAVARALLPRLLAPAGMIAGAGLGLLLAAFQWQRSADRRDAHAGATAFLGEDADEELPSFWDQPLETATLRSPMGAGMR
jgi:hypothetical protein